MILCDTGVLFCLCDQSQPKHQACKESVQKAKQPLLTTWSCLTETMYLALNRGGWIMQQQIAKLILNQTVQVFQIQIEDYERLFALMAQYRDRPMDLADATLVIAAEKTGIKRILTLDSDFLFYRICDRESFEVIFPDGKP
jgi:uncharacterized protein